MLQTQQTGDLTAWQLEKLCQPENIERTMHLLFALNHWAKAREHLFYADRQALYGIKTSLLRQAYASSLIEARGYIDGSGGFGSELAFDMAADIAAEGLVWRLEEMATEPDRAESDYDGITHRLYTKITGRETLSAEEVEALDVAQVREYILGRLQTLEREARETRRPIPCDALMELCIAPSDLLYVEGRRYYDLGNWDSWNELDESDLRKLDPEGLSLVAFHYTSANAHYIFHLPLRLAETCVPEWIIAQLKGAPRTSRESGEYYGRAVSEAESLQLPIADILRELGVDIAATCPRQLEDKREYALVQAMRFAAWSEEEEFDDEDEDEDEHFWQDITVLARKHHPQPVRGKREPDECPLCPTPVSVPSGCARLEHWQARHPNQDLTFSQASWVLDQIEAPGQISGKQQFCAAYPPDYRAPDPREQGTRYWRIETLAGWMQVSKTKAHEC